ncbi:MAG: hypothetical protein JNJ73_06750 [Hyphomonadaceae bacterium]|nr:hypothetical protein [Hyphomonadaceae bacterium]
MKALHFVAAAALLLGAGTTFSGAAAAKEEAAAPYTVLHENVHVNLGSSVSRDFGVGRDHASIIFREGRRWYRVELLPPCAQNLGAEMRIGLVHRGPWFDRGSQVLAGDYRCSVRRVDEIADPRPARAEKD